MRPTVSISREDIDASGFAAIWPFVRPWAPDAELTEIRDSFEGAKWPRGAWPRSINGSARARFSCRMNVCWP